MAAQQISPDEPWFAVKCLFSHPSRASDAEKVLYEERITLWRVSSWDEAFRLAEGEAQEYASSDDCVFHFATDAFHLFEETVIFENLIWDQCNMLDFDNGHGVCTPLFKRLKPAETGLQDEPTFQSDRVRAFRELQPAKGKNTCETFHEVVVLRP